jgi:hypothetical protein
MCQEGDSNGSETTLGSDNSLEECIHRVGEVMGDGVELGHEDQASSGVGHGVV